MNPHSAKALAGFSAILLVVALVLFSPSAAFGLMLVAALCAIVPVVFGKGRVRLVSLLLLLASLALAAHFYRGFRRDQESYARPGKGRAATQLAPSPAAQG